ncbi:hypothetical protein ACRALDRAFT_1072304 [Sodiomyces alcalophilus JCM 7366]|uniref:uncharacterized protein n=1 Tax=Sodiomyces alcalophilus JCM 7366 TaxID=591952 RepID=UPI0039B4EA5A
MCIYLIRQYTCWNNHGNQDLPGHRPKYIRRCAIPDPRTCFERLALPWRSETYDVPCPECTGRFIVPSKAPVHVTTSIRTNREANNAAVVAYTKALCFFFQCVLGYHRFSDPDTVTDLYKACKIEVACRFNKDHFEDGAYCLCQEANEWPEYRNLSAALRRLPARGLLYPGEDDDMTRDLEMTDDWPDVPLVESCAAFFDSFQAQPSPGEVNGLLDNVPVLPFHYDRERRNGSLFISLIAKVNEAFAFHEDESGWIDQYLEHHEAPEDEVPYDWALSVREVRRNLLLAVAHLLANDNGLVDRRAHDIFDLFSNLARIGDEWTTGGVHDHVADDMTRLADPHQWEPQLTLYELMQMNSERPHSDFFLREDVFLDTEWNLWQSAEMRIEDEHKREEAVEASLDRPLTQDEYDALDETDKQCFICRMPMSVQGADTFPPTDDDEAFALGHDAVRLKCRMGHAVGKKCFMEYWRSKRLADGVHDIVCDLCGRQPLHRTPPKFLAYDLTLGEVMIGQYKRPLSWVSRAPDRWVHYG